MPAGVCSNCGSGLDIDDFDGPAVGGCSVTDVIFVFLSLSSAFYLGKVK